MMRLTVNAVEYMIHFQYGRYDGRRTTTCRIHLSPCTAPTASDCGAKPAGVGMAHCSYEDEFVKAKGRKIALARAMKGFNLPREIRMKLWMEYFKRIGRQFIVLDLS